MLKIIKHYNAKCLPWQLCNHRNVKKTRTKVAHKKVSQGFYSWEALNP